MKANINHLPLQLFNSIEEYVRRGDPLGIVPKNTINYHLSSKKDLYSAGWRDFEYPAIDHSSYRLGELFYDEESDTVTREVVEKTPDEIKADQRASVPQSITPTQGRLMLAQVPGVKEGETLLQSVLNLIPASETEPLRIYWEYATSWDRDSQFVVQMGAAIGLTDDEIDEFFITASSISI
jgi:hypothetical protein